jgi:hypothetical protein
MIRVWLAFLFLAASGVLQPAPPVRFDEVTASSGISFYHTNGASPDHHLQEIMGSGGLFFDYDNDGWVDVLLVDGGSLADPAVAAGSHHRLYRNLGNGRFEDVTAKSGIGHNPAYGMGACAADYDNDGAIDLFITGAGSNALYHNNGPSARSARSGQATVFADVTAKSGIGGGPFATSCAWADVDRDGYVDLFVTNYVDARPQTNAICGAAGSNARTYCHPLNFAPLASSLYHNNGNGTFTDISAASGIGAKRGNGLGVVIGDYDDDGWPDIVVANDSMPNFLYHNEGRGIFRETALVSGIAVAADGNSRAGMGIDLADYDGDGRLDLFITNHELETHTLFRNLGRGLFTDVTSQSGIGLETLPFVGFGAVFFDYDNDGDLDLAIANGHVVDNSGHYRPGSKTEQRKLLFRNDASTSSGQAARFKEIGRTAGAGFGIEKIGRSLSAADIDNDGQLDLLFTNNGGAPDLLRNAGPSGNNALLVRLVGTKSNRSAIGARLTLTAGTLKEVREVKAGSGYLGQSDLRQHFGLAHAAQADRLEIRWPSGQTETVTAVPANQIVTITEGKGVTARAPMVGR